MPKYLLKASYTAQGIAGVLKEGGSSRREVVKTLVEGLGGSLEAFYFGFGETDVWVIIDAPDDATVAAASMTVSAAGGASVETVKLLTVEEIDEATKKSVEYRPPGGG